MTDEDAWKTFAVYVMVAAVVYGLIWIVRLAGGS